MLTETHQIKDEKQKEAYMAWKSNSYRGLIAGCTGFGKSRLGTWVAKAVAEKPDMELVVERGEKAARMGLLVVPTIPLRDKDWPDEFRTWGLEWILEEHLKIICYAALPGENLADYAYVIFDEAHHLTEAMFRACNAAVAAEIGIRIMMLSATPPDHNEIVKQMIVNRLGGLVYELPIDEGVDLGIISDYRITAWLVSLNDKEKWVKAGTKAKPFLTTEYKSYDYLSGLLLKYTIMTRPSYLDPQTNQPLTEEEVVEAQKLMFMQQMKVNRFIANLHCKRDLCKYLIDAHLQANKRFLFFAGSISICNELAGPNAYHSESDKKKKTRTALDRFRDMEIPWIGAVNALNEGVNLPYVDGSIFGQIDSKERSLIQRIGRNVRWRENHTAGIHVVLARETLDEVWFTKATVNLDPAKIVYKDGDKLLANL